MNLSGSEVRTNNVLLLVSLLDGDETAAKLERGIQHGNPIVALSLADRERIVAVLASDAPSGLVELHAVLVKQLKHRHDRERSAQRIRLDQARIQRRREGP